jgi:hypothetical protein
MRYLESISSTISSDSLSLLQPDPIVQSVLIVASLIHLALMNMVVGGVPIMVTTELLGEWTQAKEYYQRLARQFAHILPWVMVSGMVVGIMPLMLLQVTYGPFVSGAMKSMGSGGLVLMVMAVFAMGGIYVYKKWPSWLPDTLTCRVVVGGLSAGLLAFTAFGFVTINVLLMNPEQWQVVREGGMGEWGRLTSVIPRFLHVMLASVAGVGMVVVIYGAGLRVKEKTSDVEKAENFPVWVTRYGVSWTLGGTLPQMVIGPWLLLSLPEHVRVALLSGSNLASILFFVSVICGLISLVLLNAALMVPSYQGFSIGGVMGLMITVALMVVIREQVRWYWLIDHVESLTVAADPQWGLLRPLLVWAVIIMGMGMVGWKRWKKAVQGK